MNQELSEFVGAFIGDGCISKFIDDRGGNGLEKHKVRFFSEHEEVLSRVITTLNHYFKSNVKIIKNDKRSESLREVSSSKKEILAIGKGGGVFAMTGLIGGLVVATPLILYSVWMSTKTWIRGDLSKKTAAAVA